MTTAGSGVSVIVPTYNRSRYLRACLDSLLAQTQPALEILVVDDGSSDDTARVAAEFEDRIRYLPKPNGGKPRAVAHGLRHAQGEWIWIFDDDDIALPTAIASRLQVAARQAQLPGFVYAPHLLGDDDTSGPPESMLDVRPNPVPAVDPAEFFVATMQGCFFHLNSCLVRRTWFESLGGLDPALRSGEDYDFQIRLARVATPAYCPEPAFIFRRHFGPRGATKERYRGAERDRVFRRDSAVIGRRLRNSVGLGEFLVPPGSQPLDPGSRRAAVLRRMRVMANHGCTGEMLADILELLQGEPGNGPGLSAREADEIAAGVCTGWAAEAMRDDWSLVLEHVSMVLRRPGGTLATRALARGFVRHARHHARTLPARARDLGAAARLAIRSLATAT